MNILKWAEKEFELAGEDLSKEAQKAFRALVGGDRPDWEIMDDADILVRLANRMPLTPITENELEWSRVIYDNLIHAVQWRCRRYPTLKKHIFPDGTTKYYDNSRFDYYDVESGKRTFIDGHMALLISYDIFPITFPYYPQYEKTKVYIKQFRNHLGAADTIGLYSAENPSGEEVEIERFYKWSKDDNRWVEISYVEYLFRSLTRED